MYFIIPADTSYADIFATKEFDHCGRFAYREAACLRADELNREWGHQYSVVEMRIVHTTQTLDDLNIEGEAA